MQFSRLIVVGQLGITPIRIAHVPQWVADYIALGRGLWQIFGESVVALFPPAEAPEAALRDLSRFLARV